MRWIEKFCNKTRNLHSRFACSKITEHCGYIAAFLLRPFLYSMKMALSRVGVFVRMARELERKITLIEFKRFIIWFLLWIFDWKVFFSFNHHFKLISQSKNLFFVWAINWFSVFELSLWVFSILTQIVFSKTFALILLPRSNESTQSGPAHVWLEKKIKKSRPMSSFFFISSHWNLEFRPPNLFGESALYFQCLLIITPDKFRLSLLFVSIVSCLCIRLYLSIHFVFCRFFSFSFSTFLTSLATTHSHAKAIATKLSFDLSLSFPFVCSCLVLTLWVDRFFRSEVRLSSDHFAFSFSYRFCSILRHFSKISSLTTFSSKCQPTHTHFNCFSYNVHFWFQASAISFHLLKDRWTSITQLWWWLVEWSLMKWIVAQ